MSKQKDNIVDSAMNAYNNVMYPEEESLMEFTFNNVLIPITRREYKALLAMRRVLVTKETTNDK